MSVHLLEFKSLAELRLFGLEERHENLGGIPSVPKCKYSQCRRAEQNSSVLFLQFAVCRNCAYGFSHVMDSQDVGTEAESLVVEYLTLRERFFRSYAELPEYHALAGDAYQNSLAELLEFVQFAHHLVVLLYGFANPNPGSRIQSLMPAFPLSC